VNLRLPLVAGIVLVAGAAAGYRTLHFPPPLPAPAAAAFESSPPLAVDEPPKERRGRRSRTLREVVPGGHVVVYVAGEVLRRGVYTLPASARAVDALALAGGPSADADLVAVNLAAPLTDGEELAVPPKGAAFAAPASTSRRSGGPAHRHGAKRGHRKRRAAAEAATGAAEDVPTQLVDLNVADENELETLPGIGPALASRIVEFREINGPYASLDDLLDVGGMTQRKLDDVEPYAVVH